MKDKKIFILIGILIFIGLGVIALVTSMSNTTENLEYKCMHSYECSLKAGKKKCTYKNRDGMTESVMCSKDVDNQSTIVDIYVFHGDGCPHCKDLMTFFETLSNDKDYRYKYKLHVYEVWHDVENKELLLQVLEHFGMGDSSVGVPFYVIGDKYRTGFKNPKYMNNDEKNAQEQSIKDMIDDAYYDGYNKIDILKDK